MIVSTLRNSIYGRYVLANFLSLIGTWVQRVTVGWLTWELTGSGTWLGVMAAADLCPTILIGPIGGVLADRFNRVRVMLGTQLVAMTLAIALCLLAWRDWISIELLVALVALNGLIVSINQPNRLALVPRLVPKSQLTTALAINSIAFNLARFIGPAIAGAAIIWGGAAAAFGFNAVSFIIFLAVLVRIPRQLGDPQTGQGKRRPFFAAVTDGLRFAAGDRTIGTVLILMTALGIGIRPYVELLPGFAEGVFGQGPDGLAWLASAVGAGAVTGGLVVAGQNTPHAVVRALKLPPVLASVCVVFFATSGNVAWAVACAALAGCFIAIASISAQTLIQLVVPENMRGRVMSLYGLLFRSAPAIGALIMGVFSDIFGLGPPLAMGAILAALVSGLLWRRHGRLLATLERS